MSHGPKHFPKKTKTSAPKAGSPETQIEVVVGRVALTIAHQSKFDLIDRPLVTAEQRSAIVSDAVAHDYDEWKLKALRSYPLKIVGVTRIAWLVVAAIPNYPGAI